MKFDITSAACNLSRKIRGVFCLLVGMILMGLNPQKHPTSELLLTPNDLKKIPSEQRVIIDTRAKWKFLSGHIPSAINMSNWREFTTKKDGIKGILIEDKTIISDTFSALGLNPELSIIIYGEPGDPWRTDGRFFWMFERYGFAKVALLDGGLDIWKKSGETVERGFQKERKFIRLAPESINLNPETIADKILINKVLTNKNYVLIDNRTQKEFQGATPYGSGRGGHIPKAKHIHWPDFFKNDGMLKSANDLSHLLKNAGVLSGQEVIVYCTGGVRSAMAYFVFRYLGFKVRNYDGSWWDWSQDPDLPVETSG
jgi:thiosulfate/3-mercaptopyruvate sulfurtransferase